MSRIIRATCPMAVAIAWFGVSGCADSSAGTPRPKDETSVQNSTSSVRPRELTIDGKDPCALIPQADRATFYIQRPGVADQSKVFKSPECLYSTEVGGFNIALVVTEGIEKWTDGSRSAQARQVASVAGFPAISATVPAVEHGCYVAVDVADGQYLLASAILLSSKEPQVPERCEYAHQLAESAMKTLVGS